MNVGSNVKCARMGSMCIRESESLSVVHQHDYFPVANNLFASASPLPASDRHPVDEQTLQPTRRASKAGLESLRNHLISPQLSPSLFDRKTISQTPSGGDRVGWL